jgi:hypothetical protein
MLKPLEEADFPEAVRLLAEGFPLRTAAFWTEALERLRHYSANAEAGVPLGQLLMAKGQAVGVALTPASVRTRPDGAAYRLINFSSWYIQPDHRWRAAMMFRQIVADTEATFLDLTPAVHVQPMLPLFGFRPVSVGMDVATTLPWALLPSRGARVREFRPDDPLPPEAPSAQQLLVHKELGCWPLVLEHLGGQTLLVYRNRAIRRVPAARLMYVGEHAMLRQYLPAVARFLLARGLPVMAWDARAAYDTPRWGIRHQGNVWYGRGHLPDDCTDFIGTELCLLGN